MSDRVRSQLVVVAVHVAETATGLENTLDINVQNGCAFGRVPESLLGLFIKLRSV